MDSPPRQPPLGCDLKPLSAPGQIKSALAEPSGLKQMSDVYPFVGRLRSLQLPSADTVFVVPIPDQTAV